MSQQTQSALFMNKTRGFRVLVAMLVGCGIFSLNLAAQDVAPERIANMVASFEASNVPILPIPFLYLEDGRTYSVHNSGSNTPLGPSARYSWTKTGPNTGTLIRVLDSLRIETAITFGFYNAIFGWFGTYREGSVTGTMRLVPFALTSQAPLRNTSTRVALAPGGLATMGFVVAGATPRRVLVRAVGPALAAFGVANPAEAPSLSVLLGKVELASNSGWGGAPEMAAVFAKVGAFALPPGSRDCALVLTLSAGNYTAQVRADAGGEVLFEVYFID